MSSDTLDYSSPCGVAPQARRTCELEDKGRLCLTLASAHIPMGYYDSAEPSSPVFVSQSSPALTRTQSRERVDAVRQVLTAEGIDAFIVPTADAHNSQYIAPADARREWLSGLRGSSGTAVVTSDRALVWTDARYFTQFEVEVDATIWTLMRQGTDQSIQDWLATSLPADSVVGVDPTTYTRTAWRTLETVLNNANITLRAVPDNPVDAARRNLNDGPPARPNNSLLALGVNYTGRRSSDKLASIISQIQSRGAVALVLTALDDVAYDDKRDELRYVLVTGDDNIENKGADYDFRHNQRDTLNLRGSDIPYNPVFFSYLVIRVDIATPNVLLFWDNGVLSSDVTQHLSSEGVQVQGLPYLQIFEYLRNLTGEVPFGSTIWLSEDASQAVSMAVERNADIRVLATVSPVALMKVMKNDVELEGFRNAHVKDGLALVRALHWVHQQVEQGVNVTEVNMSDKLEEFRGQEEDFMGPSFSTIAGAGENGAIIHYSPLREGPQRIIRREDMLLIDSGGQYLDGTTDITRTRHMSTPTVAQRRAFTLVLKGQISLATAVFPAGTLGHTIEVLARKSLWDVGLNYGHGTGHGVGHFLNVHEGPAWILSSQAANDPGIRPKMVYSNEPGYYEVNEYGVRHEDLIETIEVTTGADHLQASGMVGDFDGRGAVGFYTISLAPHQTSCLDVNLLTDFELSYINSYHARVFSTLGPILQQRGFTDVLSWLEEECAPIQRSAAAWLTATPLLLIVSVFTVFKS